MRDLSSFDRIALCSGLLVRDGAVLLVRCRYAGEDEALWTLPGGRQEPAETIAEAVIREFAEETSLDVGIGSLAYVSESFDEPRKLHVLNCTFFMRDHQPASVPQPRDPKVLEARFVHIAQAPQLLEADVLRIPVAAALSGSLETRYFSFRADEIAVPFLGRRPQPHV